MLWKNLRQIAFIIFNFYDKHYNLFFHGQELLYRLSLDVSLSIVYIYGVLIYILCQKVEFLFFLLLLLFCGKGQWRLNRKNSSLK